MGVVVVAAGMGVRLGAGMPKALVRVGGRTLVEHAVDAACGLSSPDGPARDEPGPQNVSKPRAVVVVAPRTQLADFEALLPEVCVIPGGAERTDSVAAGLAALPDDVDIVLVHDAARALAPPSLFDAVAAAVAAGADAVVPGLPLSDTIKQVDAAGAVVRTPDRSTLRAVQTPQGFRRSALEAAHARGGQATDDAMLIERAGGTVQVIDGDPLAMKITLPPDIEAAERLLAHAGRVPGERSGGVAGGLSRSGERSGGVVGGLSRSGERSGGVVGGLSRSGERSGGDRIETPTLIVLGGLPGVGKTTLARALARRMPLAHIRVDTIEATMTHSGLADKISGPEGYAVAFRVAGDQLALGMSVVADTVNPMPETRDWWRDVATEHGARAIEIELTCSDPALHEQRVEERASDIPGLIVPSWQQVRDREYHPWSPDLRLDTATSSPDELADTVTNWLRSHP